MRSQKLVGEYYASVSTPAIGLETVSLRFFNVYGPRQDPSSPYSGVISVFMKCLLERSSPTIYGDGEQSRDFTYVEDVAALCVKAARAPGAAGRMFNAGNGNRYTLNEVWKTLNADRGRGHRGVVWRNARRRCAALAGRHARGGRMVGSRTAVLARGRLTSDACVVQAGLSRMIQSGG